MNRLQKEAGGELLGRLAGFLSRPLLGPARSQAVQQKVTGGITQHLNQPIESGLRRIGAHKAISKAIEVGMTPIPGTPKLLHPVMPMPEQRRAYGNWKADDMIHTFANNPEILAAGLSPVPGTTATYLGGKALLNKALTKKASDEDPAELAYWRFDSDRNRKGMPMSERDAFKKQFREAMEKTAEVLPYQQKTQWSCSAACLRAVLGHYGIDLPEELAIQAIGTRPGRGAEVTEISEGARRLGLDAFDYSFGSLEQAKFLLDQDIPIVCDIQSFNFPGKGHYVVLVSIDDSVHLMDPNTPGNTREISLEEMDARWWDRTMAPPHDVVERWGVVILPPEEE